MDMYYDNRKLKELQRKLKSIDGQHEVPLTELLPDTFVQRHTDFQTLQAMIYASGIEKEEEFGSENFSKFISTHTQFSNWDKMLEIATTEYVKRKLGL